MARIIVVTKDPDVRIVLDVFLHVMEHVVLSIAEAAHALPALQIGKYPAVVIIHAPTPADDGFELLRWAASDPSGCLARHSYIVLTDGASSMTSAAAARVARLGAQVIELPFDLEEMARAVERAECALLGGNARVLPFPQSAEG